MADDRGPTWRPTPGSRVRLFFPWLFSLLLAGAGVFTLDGVERAMAVGAFVAAACGALLYLTQLRSSVAAMRDWMAHRESDLSTFADDRAAAVARQFAWAVDELVAVRAELRRVDTLRVTAEQEAAETLEAARRDSQDLRVARERLAEVDSGDVDLLRQRLEEAETALARKDHERRGAEKRARVAEQRAAELKRTLRLVASTVGGNEGAEQATGAGPITLDWTLEYDGSFHSLRLRSAMPGLRPKAARILDAAGRAIAETYAAQERRSAQLVVRVPQSVAAAVESGDWSAFRLEVRIDALWRGAELVDRSERVDDPTARVGDDRVTRPYIRIVS